VKAVVGHPRTRSVARPIDLSDSHSTPPGKLLDDLRHAAVKPFDVVAGTPGEDQRK